MTRMMTVCAASALWFVSGTTVAAPTSTRVVARSGDAIPGLYFEGVLNTIAHASMNNRGDIALSGTVAGQMYLPATDDVALLFPAVAAGGGGGGVRVIAEETTQWPLGGLGAIVGGINNYSPNIQINNSGGVMFGTVSRGLVPQFPYAGLSALLATPAADEPLGVAVWHQQEMPGVGTGERFRSDFRNAVWDASDRAVFTSGFSARGVFRTVGPAGAGGGLELILLQGAPAPAVEPGISIGVVNSVKIGGDTIAMRTSMTNTTSGDSAGQAIYLFGPAGGGGGSGGETFTLLARSGEAAPGLAPGVTYSSLSSDPILNRRGEAAFVASVTGLRGYFNAWALFSNAGSGGAGGAGGELRPIVTSESVVSTDGTPFQLTQLTTASHGSMNDRGDVLFVAWATGLPGNYSYPGERTLLMHEAGAPMNVLRTIAWPGQQAPDTPGDLTFRGISESSFLNEWRDVAFTAQFGSSVVGAYVMDGQTQTLMALAAPGTLFDVSRDGELADLRTVTRSWVHGLNDLREVMYRVNFTDGSQGVFVTTIPSPSAAGLLVITGAVASARRRRAGNGHSVTSNSQESLTA